MFTNIPDLPHCSSSSVSNNHRDVMRVWCEPRGHESGSDRINVDAWTLILKVSGKVCGVSTRSVVHTHDVMTSRGVNVKVPWTSPFFKNDLFHSATHGLMFNTGDVTVKCPQASIRYRQTSESWPGEHVVMLILIWTIMEIYYKSFIRDEPHVKNKWLKETN